MECARPLLEMGSTIYKTEGSVGGLSRFRAGSVARREDHEQIATNSPTATYNDMGVKDEDSLRGIDSFCSRSVAPSPGCPHATLELDRANDKWRKRNQGNDMSGDDGGSMNMSFPSVFMCGVWVHNEAFLRGCWKAERKQEEGVTYWNGVTSNIGM